MSGVRGEGPLADRLTSMTDSISHRGPDDAGLWKADDAPVGLGFRRLAIIDTSPAGHQPMASASGRFVMVYNGEVYNFAEIRSDLGRDPSSYRGHSDTEIMLAAFDQWGIKASIQRFVGMFACAIWDRRDRALTLVRDRLGIKPLYYGLAGPTLVFGSELKALAAWPEFERTVDREALTAYLRHSYVPHPRTIYANARQLAPGTMLEIREPARALDLTPASYWSLRALGASAGTFVGDDAAALDEFNQRLAESTRLHMVSDVPLGAFLSGGVDSSLVVGEMQRHSTSPVKTFTIGFSEKAFDEAHFAREVSLRLGTEHTELYVRSDDALQLIPQLPEMYDEPFADTSMLPTYLVSKLARRTVTVAISGDGGDELFGGYSHHAGAPGAWQRASRIPTIMRPGLGVGFGLLSRAASQFPGPVARHVAGGSRARQLRLSATSAESYHEATSSYWPVPSDVVTGGSDSDWGQRPDVGDARMSSASRLMLRDTLRYLPDCILTKVDRASMAVSLEARPPLLDHRIVEFAVTLPDAMKIRDGRGKWLMRQSLRRYLPTELIDRPKQGFSVPVGSWLRGPLRDWAEGLLDERRLGESGFFDSRRVRERWEGFLAGRSGWYNTEVALWSVLMFEAWRERWLPAARNR